MHHSDDDDSILWVDAIDQRKWEAGKDIFTRALCKFRPCRGIVSDLINGVRQLAQKGMRSKYTTARVPILGGFRFLDCVRMKPNRRFWHPAFLRAVPGRLPMQLF